MKTPSFKIFSRARAQRLLPKRTRSSNKSHGGRSLIVAGSKGVFGAAVLAATAAARSGSGYTSLLIADAKLFTSARHPDFLILEASVKALKNSKFDAVGIGPGLGVSLITLRFLKTLLKFPAGSPVVIDADALNVSAKEGLKRFPQNWILTPHEAELARLMKLPSAAEVRADRHRWVRAAHEKFGCVVLLKGADTLVASAEGLTRISSGTPALAKAGTGDVLTGMITGLVAQGLSSHDAACLGAYVHGLAARAWLKKGNDPLGLLASDLLEEIPRSLARLRRPPTSR